MSGEKKTLGDYFVLIVLLAPNIIILSLILYGSLRDNSKQSEE